MARKHSPYTEDEDRRLRELYAAGIGPSRISRILDRTVNSVDWRLMTLGLKAMSPDKIRAKGPKPATVTRACLRCRHPFPSEGIHNRVCMNCKKGSIWQSGNDYCARTT